MQSKNIFREKWHHSHKDIDICILGRSTNVETLAKLKIEFLANIVTEVSVNTLLVTGN